MTGDSVADKGDRRRVVDSCESGEKDVLLQTSKLNTRTTDRCGDIMLDIDVVKRRSCAVDSQWTRWFRKQMS